MVKPLCVAEDTTSTPPVPHGCKRRDCVFDGKYSKNSNLPAKFGGIFIISFGKKRKFDTKEIQILPGKRARFAR